MASERDTRSTLRPAVPARLARSAVALLAFAAGCAILASWMGDYAIPLSDIVKSFWAHIRGGPPPLHPAAESILWTIRIPRVALGAVVGAALSIAGASLQGLLQNPLADPYLVGVSAGAAVGASIAVILGWSEAVYGLGAALLAFAVALITIAIVYRLSLRRGRVRLEAFLLAGVVIGSFMWALVTLVMSIAKPLDLQAVVSWLMGHLDAPASRWPMITVTAMVAAGGIAIYAFARDLNLLALGEEPAKQLGVDVELLKKVVIALASLVTAAAVSVSGIIAFVGLMVPHIVRRLVGPDHRVLLPASALFGAGFLMLADGCARGVLPWLNRGIPALHVPVGEIPVGVVTSLLGAPFFCYLLWARAERSS
jgi:iron complex transport system permease protein